MSRPALLDTCAAIWLMNGDPISAESRAAIAAPTENLGIIADDGVGDRHAGGQKTAFSSP